MKKVLLLTTIFTLIAVSNIVAQSVEANVAVTATVNNTLSIVASGVEFGNVNAGTASYVNAGTGDATTSSNSSAPVAGELAITADEDATLFLSWEAGSLTDTDGNNATAFTPTVVFNSSTVADEGSIALTGTTGDVGVGGTLAAISAGTGAFSTANTNGVPVVFTIQYGAF